MTITVMGIDASLRGMAYALAGPELRLLIGRSTSEPASGVRGRVQRYRSLVDPIVELARQHTPRLVLIESYAYGVQGSGVIDRAELGGILRDRLLPHCEMFVEPGTSQIKKFATGFGGGGALPKGLTEQQRKQQLAQRRKDSKGAVKTALEAMYGVRLRNDDEADAFALLQMGLCLCGLEEPRADAQRDVVEALREKAQAAA